MDTTPQSSKGKMPLGRKMSSSLKERLKKCGRYHPGTPTSSHTSQSSLLKTKDENISTNFRSRLSDGFLSKDIQSEDSTLSLSDTNDNQRISYTSKSSDSFKLKNKVRSASPKHEKEKKEGTFFSTYASCDIIQEQPKTNATMIPLTESICDNQSCVPHVSETKSSNLSTDEKPSHSKFSNESEYPENNDKDLLALKKKLQTEINQQEERLRKLKMVKMYREKNDLTELQRLIDTWRDVSQSALTDLLELQPPPKPSMTDLINHIQVDPEFIRYNAEDESFF